jgi:small-conductance mechanosensitive channel
LQDNLRTIIARRAANGAVTALVLVGAGLAALLLPVLGYGSSARSNARSGTGSLVILAALVVGALVAESALITRELPQLLAGARP